MGNRWAVEVFKDQRDGIVHHSRGGETNLLPRFSFRSLFPLLLYILINTVLSPGFGLGAGDETRTRRFTRSFLVGDLNGGPEVGSRLAGSAYAELE